MSFLRMCEAKSFIYNPLEDFFLRVWKHHSLKTINKGKLNIRIKTKKNLSLVKQKGKAD